MQRADEMVLFSLNVGNRAYTHAAPVKLQQNAAMQYPLWKLVGRQTPENLKIIKPNSQLFVQHKLIATGTGVSGYNINLGLKKTQKDVQKYLCTVKYFFIPYLSKS